MLFWLVIKNPHILFKYIATYKNVHVQNNTILMIKSFEIMNNSCMITELKFNKQ